MQRGKEVWTEGRTESVDEGRERSKITDERGKGKGELQKHEVGTDLNADRVRGGAKVGGGGHRARGGARLHATCRKPGGSSFDTAPPQENGLWHRKEIQYRAFTKLQPAWEPAALKYSNKPACS